MEPEPIIVKNEGGIGIRLRLLRRIKEVPVLTVEAYNRTIHMTAKEARDYIVERGTTIDPEYLLFDLRSIHQGVERRY